MRKKVTANISKGVAKKIMDKIYCLSDSDIYQLYKYDLPVDLEVGKSHFNHDDRLLIGIAILTDYHFKKIQSQLSKISNKNK